MRTPAGALLESTFAASAFALSAPARGVVSLANAGRRDEVSASPLETSAVTNELTGTLRDVLKDRRFWVVVAVVICINSTWHFFRVWMPVILTDVHGFTSDEVQVFSIGYYLAADLGSLATGFLSVWLVRGGMSVHGSRLSVFGVCAVLFLAPETVAYPMPRARSVDIDTLLDFQVAEALLANASA